MTAFALFDTAIGRCVLVWRGGFIVGSALPEESDALLRASMRRRFREAQEADPPSFVLDAMAAVTRLLSGCPEDLSALPLDLAELSDFERLVLEACLTIKPGVTRTYGDLAAAVGSPGTARAVGAALGRNPIPIIIPCHRVLAASGRSGGFSAPGGAMTKLRMLQIEGARREGDGNLFDNLPLQVRPHD